MERIGNFAIPTLTLEKLRSTSELYSLIKGGVFRVLSPHHRW